MIPRVSGGRPLRIVLVVHLSLSLCPKNVFVPNLFYVFVFVFVFVFLDLVLVVFLLVFLVLVLFLFRFLVLFLFVFLLLCSPVTSSTILPLIRFCSAVQTRSRAKIVTRTRRRTRLRTRQRTGREVGQEGRRDGRTGTESENEEGQGKEVLARRSTAEEQENGLAVPLRPQRQNRHVEENDEDDEDKDKDTTDTREQDPKTNEGK